ncbi:hypothetical protein HYS93_03565 [Candidatus Daviesbacteria bacterium]|nr:hypothetical protein [Candidatus Daviesbacteria bacterium]
MSSKLPINHNKTKDELINFLLKNEAQAQEFFKQNNKNIFYAHANQYSFEKFKSLIKTISRLSINHSILEKLELALIGKYNISRRHDILTLEQAKKISKNLLEGRVPLASKKRSFRFKAKVGKNSFSEQISILSWLWKEGLKSLLVAHQLDRSPRYISKSIKLLCKEEALKALPKRRLLIKRLKLDKTIDEMDLKAIAKDLRFSLLQRASSLNQNKTNILNLSRFQIILLYLNPYLPQSQATLSWKKKFIKCLQRLEKMNQQKEKTVYKKAYIGVTFLDKKKDLLRSLRFADAANNCLSSAHKTFSWTSKPLVYKFNDSLPKLLDKMLIVVKRCGLTPAQCIAFIHKDPLSFIIEIKDCKTNYIRGFTTGKISINPLSGKTAIMINGIYLTEKNPYTYEGDFQIIKHVLYLIETKLAPAIKADMITIPALPNKSVRNIPGYQLKKVQIDTLMALNNILGLPKQIAYDDYGDSINKHLTIQAYVKQLSNYAIPQITPQPFYKKYFEAVPSLYESVSFSIQIVTFMVVVGRMLFKSYLSYISLTIEWLSITIPYFSLLLIQLSESAA